MYVYISSCNSVNLHLLLRFFFLIILFYSVVDYLARHNIIPVGYCKSGWSPTNSPYKNVVSALCKVEGAKTSTHPKATLINISQPSTLYYLEPFLMDKECPGPRSDGFRYHLWLHLIPGLRCLHIVQVTGSTLSWVSSK